MADAGVTCYSPGDTGLLGLRLGGLFGILCCSALGVTIPFFAYTSKLEVLFFWLRAFASGVVLTTGKALLLLQSCSACNRWEGSRHT